jgi:hypothetical protein
LSAGKASISATTANGDRVALLGTSGSITASAVNPVTGADLGVVVSGPHDLAVHGDGGGNP